MAFGCCSWPSGVFSRQISDCGLNPLQLIPKARVLTLDEFNQVFDVVCEEQERKRAELTNLQA
jgi:hypothetical protein